VNYKNEIKVHPKLLAVGYGTVPTIVHDGNVRNGTKDVYRYITRNIGNKIILIPYEK